MDFLASLFVGKPLNILAVATLLLGGYLGLSHAPRSFAPHPGRLLVASVAWAAYGAWEWLVQVRTPEANIRIDLLLLWPALAFLSGWSLVRAFR